MYIELFFLFSGLENLHALSRSNYTRLRIDLKEVHWNGNLIPRYAMYDEFFVGNESSDYTVMKLSGFRGEN